MSQQEPKEPYVYQPDPSASLESLAWAVSGPGTKDYEGKRYTKADAEAIVRMLKIRAAIDALVGNGGRRCEKCGGQMAHYRLWGYRCMSCH